MQDDPALTMIRPSLTHKTDVRHTPAATTCLQVELVGCTGAGKSTLVRRAMELAADEGVRLASGDQVVLDSLRLAGLTSTRLRSGAVHLVAGSACLTSVREHASFVHTAHRILQHVQLPRRSYMNQMRRVLKQLGRYEVVRRQRDVGGWVLVDEGTVQSAHNVFVHVGRDVDERLVRSFAETVPLPDVVIYLKASLPELIERTLKRGHSRIPSGSPTAVAEFVQRAVATFDQVVSHERVARRTYVLAQGQDSQQPTEDCRQSAQDVVQFLKRAWSLLSHPDKQSSCGDASAIDVGSMRGGVQ